MYLLRCGIRIWFFSADQRCYRPGNCGNLDLSSFTDAEADCVAVERLIPGGRVPKAACVAVERLKTNGRVGIADGDARANGRVQRIVSFYSPYAAVCG